METMKIASYPRFRSTYCCTPPCSLSSRPPLSCIVYCSCSHCFQHRCWSLIRPRPGLDLYTFPAPFLRIQVCPKIKLHQSSSSTAKQSNSANMYGPAQSHQQHPQLLTIHQDNFDFEGWTAKNTASFHRIWSRNIKSSFCAERDRWFSPSTYQPYTPTHCLYYM